MLSPGGATQWGVMLKFDAPSLDSQLFGHGFSARDDEGELQGFWNVVRALWRAKLLIALAAVLCAVLAFAHTTTLTPRYTAVAQVMVDTRVQRDGVVSTADAVLPTTTAALESELAVLQSLDLVELVVEALGLDQDREFAPEDGAAPSLLDRIRGGARAAISFARQEPEGAEGSATTAGDEDDKAHDRIIASVASNLTVEQATNGSAVYLIAFTSSDPAKAALIADTFAETYLGLQRTSKLERLTRVDEWLSARSSDLSGRLAEISRKLEAHKPDAPFSSDEALRKAREERDELSEQRETARLRGNSSKVAELERAIAPLDERIAAQSAHEAETARLESELRVAEQVYARVIDRLSDLKQQGDILEADARIIAHARPPLDPSVPRVPLYVAAGGLLGGLLCSFLIVLRELFQKGLRSIRDFEQVAGLPVLGIMPRDSSKNDAPLHAVLGGRSPDPRAIKSMRKLRATLAASGRPHRVIAVTSSLPGEGKSSALLMLAYAYAQAGERTLILDLDPWRSPFRRAFRFTEKTRTDILGAGDQLEQHVISSPNLPLSILFAGGGSEDLARAQDLLQPTGGALEALVARYDRILVDLPPVLPVADFAHLANIAESTLFAIRWNSTPRSAVQSALRILNDVGVYPAGLLATLVRGEKAHGFADDAFSYTDRRYMSGY